MPRPKRFCVEDGCDGPRVGRGWCGKHYQRWYSTGSTADPIVIDEGWPEGMKPCSKCGEMKSLEGFSPDKKARSGRASWCRACVVAGTKRWQVSRRYGLAEGEYERMLAEQGGACASCQRPPAEGSRLCIDHCHATNRVRGLLCDSCNLGLGKLGDSIEGVLGALIYLLESEARRGAAA